MFLINIHSVLLSEIILELQCKPVKRIASWEKKCKSVGSSSVSDAYTDTQTDIYTYICIYI